MTLVLPFAAALLLLATGAAGWGLRLAVPVLAGLGGAGAAAGLFGVGGSAALGVSLRLDPLSGAALLTLFLLAGSGGMRPLVAGAAALLLLAGDAVGLALAAALLAVAPLFGAGLFGAEPLRRRALLRVPGFAVLAGGAALLPVVGPGSAALPLFAVAAVLAAAFLAAEAGPVVAVYLAARLLLALPGPAVPGWWGVPALLAGGALALFHAQRVGVAGALSPAVHGALGAAGGLALAGLGAALLARGADLPSAAGLAATGAMATLLATGAAGAVLFAAAPVLGDEGLAGAGGALRRAPLVALAALTAFGSLGLVPLLPGFAGFWLVLQGLFGAGRGGGAAVPLLVAGVVALLGTAAALNGLGMLRVAGLLLLGVPRSPAAEAVRDPAGGRRAALALGGAVLLAAGVAPGLLLWPAARAAALLAPPGAVAGVFAAGPPEGAGYRAGVAALLAGLGFAAAVRAGRGDGVLAVPWTGGFVGEGAGGGNMLPLHLPRPLRLPALGAAGLAAALLLLAGLVGWAAR